MEIFLSALGLAFIMEGLPYFAFPERIKKAIGRMASLQEGQLRSMGFIAMVAGLFLILLGRGYGSGS